MRTINAPEHYFVRERTVQIRMSGETATASPADMLWYFLFQAPPNSWSSSRICTGNEIIYSISHFQKETYLLTGFRDGEIMARRYIERFLPVKVCHLSQLFLLARLKMGSWTISEMRNLEYFKRIPTLDFPVHTRLLREILTASSKGQNGLNLWLICDFDLD